MRSPIHRLLAGTRLTILLVTTVAAADTHPAVAPNQDFSNPMFLLHAPASEGWHGFQQSARGIAFAKNGAQRGESYVAEVTLFSMPQMENNNLFVAYVKEQLEKDSPPERFDVLENDVQYTGERGYPCVKYHGVSNDRKARVSMFSRQTLRLEVVALYCEYPARVGTGFAVVYSHRGTIADEHFAADGASFIEGVQARSAAHVSH